MFPTEYYINGDVSVPWSPWSIKKKLKVSLSKRFKSFPAWYLVVFCSLQHLLMSLLLVFCYSSAEQQISLPHVNSWLHIHSPREGCRKRLPASSDDALYAVRGQTRHCGFFHSSPGHEVNMWSWSGLQVQFLVCLAFPFLFPSSFLCVLPEEGEMHQNNSKTRKKSDTFTLLAVILLALIATVQNISTAAF